MRLIDADALLKGKQDHTYISTHLIWNAPTVDPIKHGRWVKIESDDWTNATEYRCSECGKYRLAVNPVDYNWNYCPNCGARMEV